MYVPTHFAPADEDVHQLLDHHGAADLITVGPEGLEATMLPFVHDRARGTLLGHLARNNDHWRRADGQQGLVIVRGPDSYVSPTWYASKAEHGRVVPTWNYVTAHVHGTVTVHDDVDWLADVVRRLTDLHERRPGRPRGASTTPRRSSSATSCARSWASRSASTASTRSSSSARTGRRRTSTASSRAFARSATPAGRTRWPHTGHESAEQRARRGAVHPLTG